jgi:dCMP deaminase
MILFSGAIGAAYHKLYRPIMAYKDELEMLIGFEIMRGKE